MKRFQNPFPLGLALAFALSSMATSSSQAAFTFEFVVNRDSVVPGSSETFNVLGLPALDGNDIAFRGIDSGSVRGIYTLIAGNLQAVANTQTPIPDGIGFFTDFGEASLDDGEVAFYGVGSSPQTGVYTNAHTSGLRRVVDENTAVPGLGGTFSSFQTFPSIDAGRVAFAAIGQVLQERGIYFWDGALSVPLSSVADIDTGYPGTSFDFGGFNNPSLDGDQLSFIGNGSSREGVFRIGTDGTGLTTIVNDETPVPGLGGESDFLDFPNIAVLSGLRVGGMGAYSSGRAFFTGSGGTVEITADTETAIPEGSGTFNSFPFSNEIGPSFDDCATVFVGSGPDNQKGIYLESEGTLEKVIDITGTLDGQGLQNLFISREALSGNRIAFAANYAGGGSSSRDAIWIATSDVDLCTGDPTAVPSMAMGLRSFLVVILACLGMFLLAPRGLTFGNE